MWNAYFVRLLGHKTFSLFGDSFGGIKLMLHLFIKPHKNILVILIIVLKQVLDEITRLVYFCVWNIISQRGSCIASGNIKSDMYFHLKVEMVDGGLGPTLELFYSVAAHLVVTPCSKNIRWLNI